MKKPPKAASSSPTPFDVCNLRIAVTSKPQPVALSTATGTNEVAGCALRRAVSAKNAAMRITTPSAVQSKPFTLREDGGKDIVFVVEAACDWLSGALSA